MNRKAFIEQLEKLLMDIPQEERIEALTYYNSYFEDAGIENEARIIRELESPEKVAGIIKADIGIEEEKEYTETGYADTRFYQQEEMVKHTGTGTENTGYQQAYYEAEKDDTVYQQMGSSQGQNQSYGASRGENGYQQAGNDTQNYGTAGKREDRTRKIVLIILAAIVTSPIWVGILGGITGVLLGIVGAVFGISIAAVAVVFAFYISGFVFAGVGISMLITGNLAVGLGVLGAGFLVLALAILGTLGCSWVFGRFYPWLVRGIIKLCSRLFHRKEQAI